MPTHRHNSTKSVIIEAAMRYIWVLAYYSYVESTCMTASMITLFTLLYLTNSVIIKYDSSLNILHNIFNLHDTQVVIIYTISCCYIWVLVYFSYVESTCMAASILTLFTLFYLSVDILLLCRKHVHGRFYNNTVLAVTLRYNSVNSVIIEAAMHMLST
jgi:hypothetical protein